MFPILLAGNAFRAQQGSGLESVPQHAQWRILKTDDPIHAELDYKEILGDSGKADFVWRGTVRLDQSLADRLPDPVAQDGLDVYTIQDSKYGKRDSSQFDNSGLSKTFPDAVTLIISDGVDLAGPLGCHGFLARGSASMGFWRREGSGNDVVAKGFILEAMPDGSEHGQERGQARLAAFQFDNGDSENEVSCGFDGIKARPSLSLVALGCAAFASGSSGSSITFANDPKRSVTVVFAASDQRPFVARLGSGHGAKVVTCDSGGFSTSDIAPAQDMKAVHFEGDAPAQDDPKRILDTRLARGEITIHEYEKLRRAMD